MKILMDEHSHFFDLTFRNQCHSHYIRYTQSADPSLRKITQNCPGTGQQSVATQQFSPLDYLANTAASVTNVTEDQSSLRLVNKQQTSSSAITVKVVSCPYTLQGIHGACRDASMQIRRCRQYADTVSPVYRYASAGIASTPSPVPRNARMPHYIVLSVWSQSM